MTTQDKIIEYFERNPQLRVLFIFNDPFLREDLKEAAWPVGYRYMEFANDWFTVKYRLDRDWKDDKVVLYFDQSRPTKQEQLEKFPLLDVLAANMEYSDQDWRAFMQQYRLPQQMATFVEKNIQQLQSSKTMRLLLPYYSDGTISEDVAMRGFLSQWLGASRVLEWDDIVLRIILQGRKTEREKQTDFYQRLNGARMERERLDNRLVSIFGQTADCNTAEKVKGIVEVLKYNTIVQSLAPSPADNYNMLRRGDTIALQKMNSLLELARSQTRTAKAFEQTMDELGNGIHDEDIVRWYGYDVTYGYLPTGLLNALLKNIIETQVEASPEKAIEHLENIVLKVDSDHEMSTVMDYALLLARFYKALATFGAITLNTPDEYVDRYKTLWYQADQLYRLSIETYCKISSQCQLVESISKAKTRLDIVYANFTNSTNIEWMRCVTEKGVDSISLPRQDRFFKEIVTKAMRNGQVAVIVSDALRYEVAKELVSVLLNERHETSLVESIAMLPTETKYCKPSLLPHEHLTFYGNGDMGVDGRELDTTEKRQEQIAQYVDGGICVEASKVINYNNENRQMFKERKLAYVMHDTIDRRSHSAASAKDVVNSCRETVNELLKLTKTFLASYNTHEVIITSDHGFLMNDQSFAEKDKHQVCEDATEKKSRYYITHSEASQIGIAKYPLNQVSGMENTSGLFVAVPEGTNRLAAPSGGYMFTHGGASMQEIITPIIISHNKKRDDKQPVGVTILERKLSIQASRLRFRLLQTEAVDTDYKRRDISVALYEGDKLATQEKVISLDLTDPLLDNRKIPVDLTLNRDVSSKVLQLRVYATNDMLNPLIRENVTNNTLISTDFEF